MEQLNRSIVRMLVTGITIDTAQVGVNHPGLGTELRKAIGLPAVLAEIVNMGIPLVISWDADEDALKYTFGGFYIPLVLFQKCDCPITSRDLEPVVTPIDISNQVASIFFKIHEGRGSQIQSLSPWMPYLLMYNTEISEVSKNTYIITH